MTRGISRRTRIVTAAVAIAVVLGGAVASQPSGSRTPTGPGLARVLADPTSPSASPTSPTTQPSADPTAPSGTSTPTPQPTYVDPPPGAVPAPQAVAELKAAGGTVSSDRAGRVLAVVATPGNPFPTGKDAFVRKNAAAFGVPNGTDVRPVGVEPVGGGDTITRYQQEVNGVPVMGGEILVTANVDGQVVAATSAAESSLPVTTSPTVAAGTAVATALVRTAELSGRTVDQLVGEPSLWLYDAGLMGAPGRDGLRPTWLVAVGGTAGDEVGTVLVDALAGTVEIAVNAEESADRIVCDVANVSVNTSDLNAYACNSNSPYGRAATTRPEGAPPSSVVEVNRAYDALGATLNYYATNFGRDGYDGRGTQVKMSVRMCRTGFSCPYRNAQWNGYQIVFGDGWATDDVVGHEFTHAVTQYSSQLFYMYESGAINEAMSDIMGEFIDQSVTMPGEDTSKLWLMGEDLPFVQSNGLHEIRDMANPNRLGQPSEVYGTYWATDPPNSPFWDNGGVHTNSGPANYAAYWIATHIGVAKSTQLWYRVMHLLPAGANYRVLGLALLSACQTLVGHGLVRDDCVAVNDAVLLTAMLGSDGWGESPQCGPNYVDDVPNMSEDFESRSGWSLNPDIWRYIPDPEVPTRVATSGTTSLYGYAFGSQVGYAEQTTPFLVAPRTPVSVGPYVFANVWGFSGSLGFEYNAGGGWISLGSVSATVDGYHQVWGSLQSLIGQSIRLRLRIAGNGSASEWLVDDLAVSGCSTDFLHFREPYFFSGTISGSTGTVTFNADTMATDHFEFTYSPAIPGAPATGTTAAGNLATHTYVLTLNNLNPDQTYKITVTQVSSGSYRTRPVEFTLARLVPPSCPSMPPSFLVIWTPPRTHSTPAETCDLYTPPRRGG